MKRLFLLVSLSWVVCSSQAAQIELKPQADVTLPDVRLSDVVSGTADFPDGALDLIISAAPALGENKKLTREVIENALKTTLREHRLVWTGAVECMVNRPARLMTSVEVGQLIEAQLKISTGGVGTVRLEELADSNPWAVPLSKNPPEIEMNASAMTSEWANATIRFKQDGQTLLMKSIRFRWSWTQDAWKATRSLSARTPLSSGDFQATSINVLGTNGRPFIGALPEGELTLIRALTPGMILTEACVGPRVIVKRGAIVQVNYRINSMTVTIKGTAMQDGTKGQTIGVMNLASNKQVLAKIADEGVLEYVR